MANRSVSLPFASKIKNKWPFSKVAEELSTLSTGEYYPSWYEGSRKHLDSVSNDPKTALAKLEKKRPELAFVAVGGKVKTSNLPTAGNGTRKTVSSAIKEYLEDSDDRQGKSRYGLTQDQVDCPAKTISILSIIIYGVLRAN